MHFRKTSQDFARLRKTSQDFASQELRQLSVFFAFGILTQDRILQLLSDSKGNILDDEEFDSSQIF